MPLISDLIDNVTDLDLPKDLESSLTKKLDHALAKLEDANPNNDVAAIGNLNAFINEVKARRGKKIADDDADQLIADALFIITILEDGLLGGI